MEALKLMPHGSAWFSREQHLKGTIAPGKYADFAILSEDYFSVPEANIKNMTSVMTLMGGKIVYANAEYKKFSPPELPVSPDWSPVNKFGGYCHSLQKKSAQEITLAAAPAKQHCHSHTDSQGHRHVHSVIGENGKWNMNCPCHAG
jgi:hypothetical protein